MRAHTRGPMNDLHIGGLMIDVPMSGTMRGSKTVDMSMRMCGHMSALLNVFMLTGGDSRSLLVIDLLSCSLMRFHGL